MNNPTDHLIDLKELINRQKSERYRSLLILAEPFQNKAQKAQRLARKIDGQYFNMLRYFENSVELCTRIDRFRLNDLEELLLTHSFSKEIVVVDELDFLLDTWADRKREGFVNLLMARRLDTFERGANLFVFFALDDPHLRQNEIKNTRNDARIRKLSEVSI